MKASIYKLVQKRKELLKDLENLKAQRKEEATEKRRVGDEDAVEPLSLEEYDRKRHELMEKVVNVTVALREQNVDNEIPELGITPEEARIKRDMLDKEIDALRKLTETSESSYLRGDSDVVKVSKIDQDELDRIMEKLTEKRGRLDTELQRFNLNTEVEVEI